MLELQNKPGLALAQGVTCAFRVAEAGESRSAWSVFTPCARTGSLVQPVTEAAKNATSGDVVLLSPTGSGFDQFRYCQHRAEVVCQAVKSIGGGVHGGTPNISGNS
jgi:UDP-N-acetylmuramoylalanine--D-glutamate ligase